VTAADSITLANCDQEPIRVPGAIQPHGAMLAMDRLGIIVAHSANFSELMGFEVVAQGTLPKEKAGHVVMQLMAEGLAANGVWANSAEAVLNGKTFDVVGHVHDNVLYLEFEPRPPVAASFTTFANYAQRIISQIQMCNDVDTLMVSVTDEVRRMTGYDRVMAYRFHKDDSGEVVAEARRSDLVSYLGQRYPASDIPAQARQLYIQNPIRLIADVSYVSTPLVPSTHPVDGRAFDLSFSTLRSVSPIHCEYLSNMGVQASMSVSIVVQGKLWGLFACHHMTPKTVPHPVRMSFQVCSHVCSAMVERLELNQQSERRHQANERLSHLVRQVRESEDLVAALTRDSLNIADLLPCDGAVVVYSGRVKSLAGSFDSPALKLIEELEQNPEQDFYYSDNRRNVGAGTANLRYCGVMAMRFHPQDSGWLVWFRLEEIHKVRWGGKPEKIIAQGPSGPRLTPRGSFEAWEEIVRGRSAPWTTADIELGEKLRQELVEICLHRASEVDRMRQRLIATLGHDLRNPLQSISMAASMLRSGDDRSNELRDHISFSSHRMGRLISLILEMSRLQAGVEMNLNCEAVDVSALLENILAETQLAYPDLKSSVSIQPGVIANVDPDRYAQIAANLLSNARHHKKPGTAVDISFDCHGDTARLRVSNFAESLSDEQLDTLFVPFKQHSLAPERNRGGLGLGLYICAAIAKAHQGRLHVAQEDGRISFTLELPRQL